MLNQSQKDQYAQNGYLVLNELFSDKQMNQLKNAAMQIVEEFDPKSTRSTFSTEHADTDRDDYFLSSGDKVRCFFEDEAFSADGELQQDKALSINKIGHALHNNDPDFIEFSQAAIIGDIARDLGVIEPEIRQSMYIFKQPKIGGVIRWHQDASYFMTTPMSVVTFWFAIENATVINGCLQVQRNGANFPLKEQFKRYQDDSTELINLHKTPWPKDDEAVSLEVKAGTLVVFNGLLPHFSAANRSDKSRHAFTLHITSSVADYHPLNWLQAKPTKLLK